MTDIVAAVPSTTPTASRRHFVDEIDRELSVWRKEIAHLRHETKTAADHLSAEAYVEAKLALEALRKDEAQMDDKLVEFQSASDDAWESMKEGVEAAWQDLQRAGRQVAARFKKHPPSPLL